MFVAIQNWAKGYLEVLIKRIDFNIGKVDIKYTAPLTTEKDRKSRLEFLSIVLNGEPSELKARTFRKTFALTY